MGVNTEYIAIYGIKKDYYFVRCYKSKKDPKYLEDIETGEINLFRNIVFKDNMPDQFIVLADSMSCEYSAIGLLLHQPVEYIEEIKNIEIGEREREKYMSMTIRELDSLGITFSSSLDVKFYSFIHFT